MIYNLERIEDSYENRKKETLLILSFLITVVFIFFSIPKLMQKDKVDNLLERMEMWEKENKKNE